jgi:glycosyltransferase involved in cell wall biosynthesis
LSTDTAPDVPAHAAVGTTRAPRILIVARGFPPSSDPTSYRWMRFASGLTRNGWGVEVLTTEAVPKFEYFDPDLPRRIHAGVIVHRAHPGLYEPRVARARLARTRPGGEADGPNVLGGVRPAPRWSPRQLLRNLDAHLQPFKIPDPSFEWILPGTLAGYRLFANRRFDLIVSSAAPFSSHVVAQQIHRLTRTPWVADFSDPFALNPFVSRPPWRERLDLRLETAWFGAMSGAIVPVPEMKAMFLARHASFPERAIHVIPYGYDETLYASTSAAAFEGFTVVHTGTFYPKLRDPGPFFEALALVRELPIRVVHAGVLHPESEDQLDHLGIRDRFEVLGLLPRERLAPLQLGGACLLLIGNRGGLQLPGKLLDYFGARRPILALRNDPHDIAADLVERHGAGLVVANEPPRIAEGLRQLYHWWKDGSLDERYIHDGAREYAWTNLENRLDRKLREHLGTPTRNGA